MSELSYLVTKVTVPPVRTTSVPRPSLLSRLEAGVPLMLLAAGAGFGKTTLLATWARETRCSVAWLTLDEQDNDPTHFWNYVVLALQTSTSVSGEAATALLHATPTPSFSLVLTSLLNELAEHAVEVTLVLDDYHRIDSPTIHESLAFWLAHAPACLHLILATRVEPDLSLPRLRARGHLVEIREADLQLNASEAACFLTQTMDLTLQEEDVLQLWQRTEGWIAGLQLAALSLRTHPNPSIWISQFRGSHRLLLDYIQEEILERESLSTQHFLLRTSVLTHMTAALCQQLCPEEASLDMLEALVRANLFVVPLDEERQWYRSHPLFREALLARLQAVEPEQVPLLHRRASIWYAEHHLLHEAIPHALAAHDVVWAAELIERFVVPQSWHNEYHMLRHWLGRLSPEELRTQPALAFLFAQALILTTPAGPSTWQKVEGPLSWAEHGYREAGNLTQVGAVLATRAAITGFQGQFPHAFAQAREALSLLPAQDGQWRGQCFCVLGIEAVLAGQTAAATLLFQQALALSHALGMLPVTQFATLMLGEVSLATGDFEQAASFFRQVLSVSTAPSELTLNLLTDEVGDRRTHFERLAWYGLAYLAYEQNDLVQAQHALQEALAEGRFVLIHLLTPGLLLQVRILEALGSIEQARILLGGFATETSRPEVKREVQLCQAWLALAQGELAVATRWAEGLAQESAPLALARREEESLLHARLRIAENQPEMALCLLEPMLREARTQGRGHRELQLLISRARAEAAGGAAALAQTTLLQAVTRARQEGSMRLFLEGGQSMETLLKRLLPDVREPALTTFVRHLLHAFASTPPTQDTSDASHPATGVTRLTPQEHRTLVLLAAGASNQEIASALVIGISTTKKHVAHLFRKLGAENRTQAAARAQENGLL